MPLGLIGVSLRGLVNLKLFFSALNAEEQELVRLWIISFGEAKRKMRGNLDNEKK